jgi:hypothetical protein
MHQQVLPDQRADGRHDEERRDRQQARDAAAGEMLVEQHGQQVPNTTVMTRTEPTSVSVLRRSSQKAGSVTENGSSRAPAKPLSCGLREL